MNSENVNQNNSARPKRNSKELCGFFAGECYTSASVRTEPGVSSTRPTKQDSASGRSDSSSAIQV
jgi:hypothetical protein